ncbi:hypothetical protein [Sphingomonas sp. ACRSK]|uniref:hypothetical protein n=1 Tax=Sphingomonas sp. ACRSK TaxID=2918213 RepID=UPI001EF5E07B|nr:hypothetical protein [Sphingomonas sp. ACRSK]
MSNVEGGDISPADIAPLDVAALASECEACIPHTKSGEFYGPVGELSFGTGLIVANLPYPVYLPDRGAYGTRLGNALILTHECDIDPDNIRPFNSNVLVAPIIGLNQYVNSVAGIHSQSETRSLMLNVASGNTTRLVFLPRYGDSSCPLYYGGLVDLNFLASCGVQALTQSDKLCFLSGAAIGMVDVALQNHLMRPKAETPPLPLM